MRIAYIIISTQILAVFGGGVIELRMVNHTNADNKTGDNLICDDGLGICDSYFIFCLDHFMGNDNPESCLYTKLTTGVYVDLHIIDFSTTFVGGDVNPIAVPVSKFDEDDMLLKVGVWDSHLTNLWIDQFNVFLSTESPTSEPYSEWSMFNVYGQRPNSKTSLAFEYRVYCDILWYGSSCNSFCIQSNNPTDGYYTCNDQTGEKICDPGWVDASTNCTTQTDECLSEPCLNYGLCQDMVDGYRCVCLNGVNGTHCEDNIDECWDEPCLNGGTCYDQYDGYFCDCTLNYFGVDCEEDRPKI